MRRFFITGLFVLMPLVVTIYLLITFFSILDGILGDLIAIFIGRSIPGIGAALTIILIFVTGLVATNVIGRKLIELSELIFLRIPIVRNIYQAVKQLLEAFSSSTTKDSFKRVVMIEYPRRGLYAVAFVTNDNVGEIQEKTSEKCISVFMPTTPNFTSGFFIIIPTSECVPLEMSVEEAFKLIISGGAIVPQPPTAE